MVLILKRKNKKEKINQKKNSATFCSKGKNAIFRSLSENLKRFFSDDDW
jgi:hypothetical protein